MEKPQVWVMSSDPETRRLIGLNLSRRRLRVREISPEEKHSLPSTEPQLIILDSDPADTFDFAVAKAIRQNPRLRQAPLILILATAPRSSRLVPLEPVRWLEKPLDMDALVSLVRESLA